MTDEEKEELRRRTLAAELKSFQTSASMRVVKAADLLQMAMDEYCRHTSCETECCVGKRGCRTFNRKMRDYLDGIKKRFAAANCEEKPQGAEDKQ